MIDMLDSMRPRYNGLGGASLDMGYNLKYADNYVLHVMRDSEDREGP